MQIEDRVAGITWTSAATLDRPDNPVDAAKRDELAADMTAHGWVGPPVVTLDEWQALTGAHRLAAVEMLRMDDVRVEVPRVDVEDLCAAFGVDWPQVLADRWDDWYSAAAALRDLLPADVVDYLGYDVDGPR